MLLGLNTHTTTITLHADGGTADRHAEHIACSTQRCRLGALALDCVNAACALCGWGVYISLFVRAWRPTADRPAPLIYLFDRCLIGHAPRGGSGPPAPEN